MFARCLPLVAFGLLCFVAGEMRAADEPAAPPPLLEPATDFDALIKQLDADNFADRQNASEKLSEAGAAAIEPLQKAAGSDSREASRRAIEILTKHLESDALKAIARQALEKIASSDRPIASRLAKAALNPKPEGQDQPGVIQLVPGQIQIQVQAVAGNGRNVRTKITDGVKEIEAEENGQKVKIVDDPKNGIKLEITETKDGKETTRKVEAKNAEELKKQDPEAHKIYEKYSGQGGIQIQGFQIQPGAVPLPIRPLQVRPLRRLADMREAQEQLDKASKELEAAVEQLQKAIENDRNPEELKKALERLEQVKKDVAGAKEKIGG
jgi:hypothetical protein